VSPAASAALGGPPRISYYHPLSPWIITANGAEAARAIAERTSLDGRADPISSGTAVTACAADLFAATSRDRDRVQSHQGLFRELLNVPSRNRMPVSPAAEPWPVPPPLTPSKRPEPETACQ
jgi:hypothetical protein